MQFPTIIQGGMGVGISDWQLANAVARQGQLGVVSGTGLNTVFVRRLQQGDPGGDMRRAMAHFPSPDLAERALNAYFIPGGKSPEAAYRAVPMYTANPSLELQAITVLANFVEVFLAREGHHGPVGINLMEKIQMPNPASIYGAMLAGVDYVLMGAGIPREIPGLLDKLALHLPVALTLHVEQAAPDDNFQIAFDPSDLHLPVGTPLKRPLFLAIIASTTLALALTKKATGRVDGFVIEGPTAGGHNAPPRGALQLNEQGEPIYGPRDEVDLAKIREIGLPFWLAGAYATPEKLGYALAEGAQGVQIGTTFALCAESGLATPLKAELTQQIMAGTTTVFTDPQASPTGFPFKVAALPGSLSDEAVYAARPRQCDLGYLRSAYKREDGRLGFRCPAEPVEAYLKKGGALEDTEGRKCLCNALLANVDLPQQRADYTEQPLITLGDDMQGVIHLLADGATTYSAQAVIEYLLAGVVSQ
jgi:nitronate monooxygenase